MSLDAYLIAAFAVVLTGISKSGFAGGLGILGVPLVALTMPPQEAAVLLLPILIGIDILSVWRYRTAWKARIIATLLPGAAAGIALGMAGFAQIDADMLRIFIGFMAIAFVAHHMRGGATDQTNDTKAGWFPVLVASALSGFAGFVAHAGGPPIKGTLLRLRLDKTAFVGTNALFFFTLNLAKVMGYSALGLFSTSSLFSSATLAPFLFVGVWLGFRLHNKIPQKTFVWLAYGLLALAGLNLLIVGFMSLFHS